MKNTHINITAEEAHKILKENTDIVIVDIRTPEEYEDEHIEGAINIDYYADDFKEKVGALDKSKSYLVYCRSGNRSSNAMKTFNTSNFNTVYHMTNGYLEY